MRLPDGKVLIPGVLDNYDELVEHPELVAQRIIRLAQITAETSSPEPTAASVRSLGSTR